MREQDLLFNVVYVPGTFRYLSSFLASMLRTSDVRVRIVANGCDDDEVADMQAMASSHGPQVHVLRLDAATRVEHGAVLEELWVRDADEPCFCFVDTDVLGRGRWAAPIVDALDRSVAISGAHPGWDPDPRAPAGELGLRGHYVYGTEGYLYGSSYLAAYRREEADQVRRRWSVGFGRANHADLPEPVQQRLSELPRPYVYYDTAKVVNALLQLEGYRVEYLPQLPVVHIGGMSILDYMVNTPEDQWPDPFGTLVMEDLHARDTIEVAANVAAVLLELVDGRTLARRLTITRPDLARWVDDLVPEVEAVLAGAATARPDR